VFSIGILVDDAIVVVENIHRHIKLKWAGARRTTVYAVDEVGNPTILATFAIISALLPLAFVRGLMGPYMRPIPINASAAMLFSLMVAFTISPWMAYRLFRKESASTGDQPTSELPEDTELPEEGKISRLYSWIMNPMVNRALLRYIFLAGVATLLVVAMGTVAIGFTTVKMLPHDNKSELQVVIDAPEGFTLEQTNAAARELAYHFRSMPEVTDFQIYVGTSAPFNFNGLVRHYFLRSGSNLADIQVNVVHKHKRADKSHALANQVRQMLLPTAEALGVNIKVAEIPPGPPVLSTLVAEVYGPTLDGRLDVAQKVKDIFATTDGVVDVDWEVEAAGPRVEVHVDREKAMRAGITAEQVVRTLRVALDGADAGLVHDPTTRDPVPIVLRLDRSQRAHVDGLLRLTVHGGDGRMVPLSEITTVVDRERERSRYHKNLQPVTYVYGEVAGRFEAPVYAILEMKNRLAEIVTPLGEELEIITTSLPEDTTRYIMKWDGEWHITYEVFRDMGIAFAVVMVLIHGGLVQVLHHADHHHGADPVDPGRYPARPRHLRNLLHRDVDDRFHRSRRDHRAQLDPPGGFHQSRTQGGRTPRASGGQSRGSAVGSHLPDPAFDHRRCLVHAFGPDLPGSGTGHDLGDHRLHRPYPGSDPGFVLHVLEISRPRKCG
jgi:multidrug efflux pump subunit AcrB